MDIPIHLIQQVWDYATCRQNFINYNVYLSLKFVLILANIADPDEMQRYAAFHLALHCLLKNPFKSFKYTKGKPLWLMSVRRQIFCC